MLACRTCSWHWRRPLVQPIKKVARGDIVGVRITVEARVVEGHRIEWLGPKGEGVRAVVVIGGAHGLLGGDVMEGKEGLWGKARVVAVGGAKEAKVVGMWWWWWELASSREKSPSQKAIGEDWAFLVLGFETFFKDYGKIMEDEGHRHDNEWMYI